MAAAALPLVVAGLFVLQQKRQVGFIDTQEGSIRLEAETHLQTLKDVLGVIRRP